MRFSVLGSGSKGNAVVVDGGGVRVLFDCGFTVKALRGRLRPLDLELTDITAVAITHGHGDHIKGASALAGAMRKLVYTTFGTHKMIARKGGVTNWAEIEPDAAFSIGGLSVTPFKTPHDAPGSVGFIVDDGDSRLGLCTDLGEPTDDIAAALTTCDALYLEFNHDLDMLRDGPYPDRLKRRIAGGYGHLSNTQAAQLLEDGRGPGLRRVVLAHLSEVNNTPQKALAAAREVTDGSGISLGVAPQHHPSGWLTVGDAHRAVTPAGPTSPRRANAQAPNPARASVASVATASATSSIAVRRQLSLFGGSES